MVGLVTARRLGENLSIGLRFNYHTLKIAGYGRAAAVTADAGMLLHLSSRLHFGIQLNNAVNDEKANGLPVPAIYSCGLGYDLSEFLFVSMEIVKQQSQAVAARVCMQYKPDSLILLRAMIQSRDPSLWFGVGILKQQYRMDVFSSYHIQLGAGAGLGLYYYFGKKKAEQR